MDRGTDGDILVAGERDGGCHGVSGREEGDGGGDGGLKQHFVDETSLLGLVVMLIW